KGTGAAASTAKTVTLSPEDVLGWRVTYGDLLGKPREVVIERFGSPLLEKDGSLAWDSPRTQNHPLVVVFDSATNGRAQSVHVSCVPGERLDVAEVLKKAPMLTFDTGTYQDSFK